MTMDPSEIKNYKLLGNLDTQKVDFSKPNTNYPHGFMKYFLIIYVKTFIRLLEYLSQ